MNVAHGAVRHEVDDDFIALDGKSGAKTRDQRFHALCGNRQISLSIIEGDFHTLRSGWSLRKVGDAGIFTIFPSAELAQNVNALKTLEDVALFSTLV